LTELIFIINNALPILHYQQCINMFIELIGDDLGWGEEVGLS